jgi:hypothetical protein
MVFLKYRLCFDLRPGQAEYQEADGEQDQRCRVFSAVPEQRRRGGGEQQRDDEQARW